MIAILVTMFVSMLMVAIATILILRAAHTQWLLDGHLLSAQLHRVHQVIDDSHGPHGWGVPGLNVAVLPYQKHGEVFRADLEVIPHVLHQGGWQPFTFHSSTPWMEQRLRLAVEYLGQIFLSLFSFYSRESKAIFPLLAYLTSTVCLHAELNWQKQITTSVYQQ